MDTESKASETKKSSSTSETRPSRPSHSEDASDTTSELERAIVNCAATVQRPGLNTVDGIDRVAVLVKYKAPFLDWIAKTGDGETFNSEDIGGQVYLLPYHDDVVAEDILHSHWQTIFENELDSWCTDDSAWPKPLNAKLFRTWLHTEVVDMVFDVNAGQSDDDDDDTDGDATDKASLDA